MSGYCEYCGRLVDESDIVVMIQTKQHGDIVQSEYWIGCRKCWEKKKNVV